MAVVSSDSEGAPKGVAQRPYQPCGQQMPEFYCNAPEHISLDELGDAASAGVTGTAAATTATVGQNGQPLAAEVECLFSPGVIAYYTSPCDAMLRVKVLQRHAIDGAT